MGKAESRARNMAGTQGAGPDVPRMGSSRSPVTAGVLPGLVAESHQECWQWRATHPAGMAACPHHPCGTAAACPQRGQALFPSCVHQEPPAITGGAGAALGDRHGHTWPPEAAATSLPSHLGPFWHRGCDTAPLPMAPPRPTQPRHGAKGTEPRPQQRRQWGAFLPGLASSHWPAGVGVASRMQQMQMRLRPPAVLPGLGGHVATSPGGRGLTSGDVTALARALSAAPRGEKGHG